MMLRSLPTTSALWYEVESLFGGAQTRLDRRTPWRLAKEVPPEKLDNCHSWSSEYQLVGVQRSQSVACVVMQARLTAYIQYTQ